MPVKSRSYFSWQHILAARLFAYKAGEVERTPGPYFRNLTQTEHTAFVTGAIFSAAAFLEATINELLADAAEPNGGHLAPLGASTVKTIAEMWDHGVPRTARFPVVEKYEIALTLAGRPAMDRGGAAYRDAVLLAKLRNALIHYEPDWLPDPDTPSTVPHPDDKWGKQFAKRFPMNTKANDQAPFFPTRMLGYGCARWSVQAAVTFADQFFVRLGLMAPYQPLRSELAKLPDLAVIGPAPHAEAP
jgi:hypothetical protein